MRLEIIRGVIAPILTPFNDDFSVATDLEIIYHGPPAEIQGGAPHNKGFTPGHEYMGTVVVLGPGVDEYQIGDRVAVEIHAGCRACR